MKQHSDCVSRVDYLNMFFVCFANQIKLCKIDKTFFVVGGRKAVTSATDAVDYVQALDLLEFTSQVNEIPFMY